MKMFRNLPKNEQVRLSEKYADLEKIYEDDFRPEYTYLAVSIFDHWLSREEFFEHLSDVSEVEQKSRNKKLFEFSKRVIDETQVIHFKWKGLKSNQKLRFREFVSLEAKHDYFYPAISHNSKGLFQSVLPDLDAIYIEGYEDTNIFYLKDISVKPLIEKWVKDAGLYCLEHWNLEAES